MTAAIVKFAKAALLLLPLLVILYFMLFAAAVHFVGRQDSSAPADVIIVLGAGLKRDGRPGPALTRRSRQGAALWHEGLAPVLLCTGGQTAPFPRTEAAACREVLIAAGIPANAILLEEQSRSTEENALFSQRILAELGLERAILVSDSYHILRASWLFGQRGIETVASPVPASTIRDPLMYPYSLAREFAAFNWQLLKDALRLPITHVSGI